MYEHEHRNESLIFIRGVNESVGDQARKLFGRNFPS